MIIAITCSILESSSNSDDDEMNTGVSKSTHFEPIIKQLTKEIGIFCREAHTLVRRGHNTRSKLSLMENFTVKATICRSRYNTTTRRSIEESV